MEISFECVQRILDFLPRNAKAHTAKLVCKEWRQYLQQYHKICLADIDMPTWALQHEHYELHGRIGLLVVAARAKAGDVASIKWLRGRDPQCPWDKSTCTEAARAGHIEVLQWLRGQDPQCAWDKFACIAAAKEGHLEVLQWLRGQNPQCPWDDTCWGAAIGGHLEVNQMQWLHQQDPPCPWCELTSSAAAHGGHLHVLQWLRQQDPPCPWCRFTCEAAVEGGHLEVLKWMRAQDPPCPWNYEKCLHSSSGGLPYPPGVQDTDRLCQGVSPLATARARASASVSDILAVITLLISLFRNYRCVWD